MKKFVIAIIVIAALAAAFLIPGETVEVTLPPGVSASAAGAVLKQAGIVPSVMVFRAAAKFKGTDRKLRAGTYKLRRRMLLTSLLRELETGAESLGVKVPIPEGFSTWQIAERLGASGICPADEFLMYARDNKLEGYLFPTTYFFDPGTSVEKVVAKMRAEFSRRIEPEFQKIEPKPKQTLHQMMTLASIVEREAVLAQEKPMIAAVYLNRMRMRMRLEADPTVQYAMGYWKKGLRLEDLKIPSPYNTYLHFGLPPGPICSFGVDSFVAALNPAQTDAVYFVADNTGGHLFAVTHEEHLKNKRSFKRGLKAIKERLRREERERQAVGR